MAVNGAFFSLGSLTLQSGASSNRTFNASGGGGISLTLGFTNQSSATQTFNVPIGVDASTVNFVSTSTGTTAFTGDFFLNANTAAFSGSGNFSLSGTASGTGGLTKSGSGTLTLSGTQSYTGGTTVTAGQLSTSVAMSSTNFTINGGTFTTGAANILSDSAAVTMSSGGLNLGGNDTVGSFSISGGSLNGSVTLTAATYTLQGGTVAANLGAGTATASSGTTALNGTLAGNLQVNGGTVTLGSASRLNSGSTLSISSGQLNLGGNETVAGLSGNGGTLGLGSHTLTATIASGANSFGGIVSGSGGLTKTGAGTLTLSGNNTFGGVLTVADGKLTVSTINNASEAGVLGNSANAVVLGANGQTGFLHYVGNTNASSTKAFTAASGGTAGIEVSNAATALTLSGSIGGSGAVQKGGAGTLTLSGSNTFGGALNIHDGTVQVGSLEGLGSGSSIGIGKSGTANVSTLRYTGSSATISRSISLESSNNVSGIIDVSTSGQTLTVSGQISGSSGLTKAGLGRLNLSASSSYNGPTTVSAGDLNLSGGSIANSSVNVSSGASLSGYGSVGTISGAGAINPGNSPGIITAPEVNPSGGTDFNFELTGTAPTFSNAASSVNDLIRITSATPFSQSLGTNNIINVYFSGAALFTGSTAVQYKGGFFTDQSTSFAGSITNATFNYFFANAAGTTTYNGVNFYTRSQYETLVLNTNMLISISTVAQTANFGSGNVNGEIMQFEVIPEPSTYALLALSALGLGAYQWRRRRRG